MQQHNLSPLIFALLVGIATTQTSAIAASADNSIESNQETPYEWTGTYAGVNLGAVWSGSEFNAYHPNMVPANPNGAYNGAIAGAEVNPGLQFGYLKQFQNNYVVGAEADFSYPNSSTHFQQNDPDVNAMYDRFTLHNNLQGSLRLRAGYAIERFLPYITAGISFASMGLSYNNENSQEAYSKTTTQTGWVLGGGLEYGLLSNLSIRTEYLYTDYGKALNLSIPTVQNTVDNLGAAHASLYSNVVRVAINYRF